MKIRKLISLVSVCALALSAQANASMAGLCNNNVTQYICCPANGGWIVSADCDSGASPNCQNDTGLIAGTSTTILQDCKNRGGSAVMYPFLNK